MRTPPTILAAVALASCGSSGDGGNAATPTPAKAAAVTTIALSADAAGALAFDRKTLRAKAGKVTIDFNNPAARPHAVAVEGNGVHAVGPTVTAGGRAPLTVSLKPGTYTFYCPLPGHREGGMQGRLTVS